MKKEITAFETSDFPTQESVFTFQFHCVQTNVNDIPLKYSQIKQAITGYGMVRKRTQTLFNLHRMAQKKSSTTTESKLDT